jgi:hypothetical protein
LQLAERTPDVAEAAGQHAADRRAAARQLDHHVRVTRPVAIRSDQLSCRDDAHLG